MGLKLTPPIEGGWDTLEMPFQERGHMARVVFKAAGAQQVDHSLGLVVGNIREELFRPAARDYYLRLGLFRFIAGMELGPRSYGSKTAEHVRWIQPPPDSTLPVVPPELEALPVEYAGRFVAGEAFPSFVSWTMRLAPVVVSLENPELDPRVGLIKAANVINRG